MGLTTSHGCFDAPYSTFNRFRYSLGHQIGINLDDYIGYGSDNGKNLTDIDHELMPLFNHSDCEGELSVKECQSIAKGLDKVLENFNNEIKADYDFKEKIETFRDGCLWAVENNEVVDFH